MLEKILSALSGTSRLLAVHKKSVVQQGVFHEFAFDSTALKTFDEFQICGKRSNVVEFKFERRHIPTSHITPESATRMLNHKSQTMKLTDPVVVGRPSQRASNCL